MPLKLIERVLPWLTSSLTEDEAQMFLKNMQLAGYLSIFILLLAERKYIFKKFSCLLYLTNISILFQLQQ